MRIESAVWKSTLRRSCGSCDRAIRITIDEMPNRQYTNVVLSMSSAPSYPRDLDRNANLSSAHFRAGYDSSIVPRIIVPDAIIGRLTLRAEMQLGTYSSLRCSDVI